MQLLLCLTPAGACSLISIEGSDAAGAGGEAGQRELAATKLTVETVERCALDELFADTKFLRAESLVELVKAVMWASGPIMRIAASGENSDVAEVWGPGHACPVPGRDLPRLPHHLHVITQQAHAHLTCAAIHMKGCTESLALKQLAALHAAAAAVYSAIGHCFGCP